MEMEFKQIKRRKKGRWLDRVQREEWGISRIIIKSPKLPKEK